MVTRKRRRTSFNKHAFDHISHFLLEEDVNKRVPRQPNPVENTESQPKGAAHSLVADFVAEVHDVGKYREYHEGHDEQCRCVEIFLESFQTTQPVSMMMLMVLVISCILLVLLLGLAMLFSFFFYVLGIFFPRSRDRCRNRSVQVYRFPAHISSLLFDLFEKVGVRHCLSPWQQ